MNENHRAYNGEHIVKEFGGSWKVRDWGVRAIIESTKGFCFVLKDSKVSGKLLDRGRG